MLTVAGDEKIDARSLLDEIAREGACRMLVAALEIEVAAYLDAHATDRDAEDHAFVVRNGRGRTRKVTLAAGTIAVNAPHVNDRRVDAKGERCRFTSRILPSTGPSRSGAWLTVTTSTSEWTASISTSGSATIASAPS